MSGLFSNLMYNDESTGHASNVSDFLTILTNISLDAVREMLVWTGIPEFVSRHEHESTSTLTGGDTDESPRDVAGFPSSG